MSDRPRCGAKAKQNNGEPCKNYPMEGSRRCRFHGGASLVGVANPAYKHGRNSRHAPARMEEDLRLAQLDPELGSMMDEIVVLSARESDILKRVDDGESGELWKELKRAWGDFQKADSMGDEEAIAYSKYEIGQLIINGHHDTMMWQEYYDVAERRRKLVEAERKREHDRKLFLPLTQALALFGAIRGIIKRHVRDPNTQSAIFRDIRTLMGGRDLPEPT